MPLLNLKPWFPESQKPDVLPDAKIYHVRQTGEVFATYEEYISRIILLTSRQWQSTNGKTGLTYEQALREDELAQHLLEKFPKELEEAAVKTAHHSLLPLEELVNVIHSSHCSPSVSGKENLPGQNGEPTQAGCSSEVAPDSIRRWLMTATRKEDHGNMSLWVAKQEYQQRYKLAEHVPQELAKELAEAAKAAKDQEEAAPKSPSKSTSQGPKKRKSDGATQVEKGAKQATAAKPRTPQKKVKPVEGKQPQEHRPPPPLRSIEEEEERLKPGTHKSILFLILKEAGADGMNVQQMVDAAKQRGLKEYDGSNRKVLSETLRTDPAFVRVAKGVYALRALMGDRPYEAVGLPKKKLPKAEGSQQAGTAQAGPSTKKEGSKKARTGQPSSPETKKRKKAEAAGPAAGSPTKKAKQTKQAEPQKQPEEQDRLPPVRSIEEEEKHMKPGSNKDVAFRVLKEAGPGGLTIQQIMDAAKQKELKDFTDSPRGSLSSTLTTDPAFVRVTKGVYALRALMGEIPYEAVGRPKKRKPRADQPGAELADVPPEGTAGASTEQVGNDQEVESRTKGEQIQNEVRRALDAHRQALAKAQAAEQRAQARMAKATQDPRTPSKKVHEDALGPMPSFELTEEQKAFRGNPDHRKDAAAHRKHIASLVAEQKAAKNEWLVRLAEAREKDAKASGHQDVAKAQRGLKSAQKKVAVARSELASAEQALKDAAKAVHKEKAKKAADEKRAEERRLREEAKVQERERKKAEALEAKRYPMEDLQLLEEQKARAAAAGLPLPAEDVPLPAEWLSKQDSAATSGLLYVTDLLAQFPKVLKVSSVPHKEMLALLEGCAARGSEQPADSLWELYQDLLTLALQESEEDSSERAWQALLNKGTLAEVLHRYLDSRQRVIGELFSPGVSEAASALAAADLDSLTSHQHLVVLSFLCDDVLDGEAMREALQERLDNSDDVKREMREAVAEKKGTLKEILESEREEKRRKREEEKAAKKAKEDAQKAQQEATGGDPASKEAGLPQAQTAAAEDLPEPAGEGADAPDDEEGEPSWDLPAELQDFQGDPTDRKGMLTFRQTQQAARKRLEKEKEKWLAAARQRTKEREARQRAAAEAERAKAKAKAAAEEELVREQEAYERELEKFHIRRAPLGLDRRHRQYWWGLAGQRGHIYVEDDQGRWAVLRTKGELDALMAALDNRGLREGGLHSALEKAYSSIIKAMKAAQPEPGKARAAPAVAATDRFPKRERAQPVMLYPSGEAASQKQAANKPRAQTVLEGLAGAALEATVGTLARLQREMAAWGVAPPEEGWKAWSARFKNAATEADAAPGEEGSLNGVLATFKTCLVDAEEMLQQAAQLALEPTSKPPNAATRASSDDSDGEDRNKSKLWSSTNEQTCWRDDIVEGKTLAAIAFSAAQLVKRSKQLLQEFKPARQPKPAAMAAPGVGPKKAAKAALEDDASLQAAQAVGPDSHKNGIAVSKAGRTRATVNDAAHEGRVPAKAAPATKSNNNAKHATRAVASTAVKAAAKDVAPKAAPRAKPVAAPEANAQPKIAATRSDKRKAESVVPPRVTRSRAK